MTPLTSLNSRLQDAAVALQLRCEQKSPALLHVDKDTTLGKWMLGGRKAHYAASCRLDESAHTASFREAQTESSWGIAPPAFKIETTRQSGAKVSSTTSAKGFGGGSTDLGGFRAACERAVTEAGWTFVFENGKTPV